MRKTIITITITLGVILLLILVFVPFGFQGVIQQSEDMKGHNIDIIAHRGASGVAPENTFPAIDLALDAGSDYIEIDVHLTKDKQVVVIHDNTVDRTTEGEGKISELTLEEITKLEAGSWFDERFRGAKIPALEEVIERVDGKSKLLIEIKKKKNQYEGIEDEVIGLVRKHDAAEWCEVQSFNDEVLEAINEKAPEIRLHKLLVYKFRFLPYIFDGGITRFSLDKYTYIYSFNMHNQSFNKDFARMLHENGRKVFLWGFCEENPCMALATPFWDGIITDYPEQYISLLDDEMGNQDE
jgi:glycerophosphoryl diester phosphodiesterase